MMNYAVYGVKLIALITITLVVVIAIDDNSFDVSELLIVAITWRAVALAIEWFRVGDSGTRQ